jgi:cytochrome c oxidase subunit 2
MKTKNVIFDSYMIAENDIENSGYRLLDVDNYIVLPIEINVRLIITAADVIHS